MSVIPGYLPNTTAPITQAKAKADGYETMKNRGAYETLLCDREVFGERKINVYASSGNAANDIRGSAGVGGKLSFKQTLSFRIDETCWVKTHKDFANHVKRQEKHTCTKRTRSSCESGA